jgi:hypothetical protein
MDLTPLDQGTVTFTVSLTDAAGNTGSASAASTSTKDTNKPTVSNIVISGTGGKKSGAPDAGDTIVLTFSEAIDLAKSCSTWSGTQPLNGTATLADANTNDTMTFASTNCPGLVGTLSLGADYIGPGTTALFGGNGNGNSTTFTFDSTAKVLTIKLGAIQNGSGTPLTAPPGIPALAPSASLADLAGNPAASGQATWAASGF